MEDEFHTPEPEAELDPIEELVYHAQTFQDRIWKMERQIKNIIASLNLYHQEVSHLAKEMEKMARKDDKETAFEKSCRFICSEEGWQAFQKEIEKYIEKGKSK